MSESIISSGDSPEFSLPSYQEQVQALQDIHAGHSRRLGAHILRKAHNLLSHEELQKISIPDSLPRAVAYVRVVRPHNRERNAVATELGICVQALRPYSGIPQREMPQAFVPVLDRNKDGEYTVAARWSEARPFSDEEMQAVREMGEELECAKITGAIPSFNIYSGVEISRGV